MHLEYKKINLHFKDFGEGDAIVFLHGFLENSTIWEPFIETFSKTNRVLCVDLLGHGKTECLGYIHTMEDMAKALNYVLKYLKIKNCIIIGHSMGGYVSLAFAELFKNKVSGLVLVNSSSREDSNERKLNRERAILAIKQNHKNFIGQSIANLFAEHNRIKFRNEIEHLKNEALKMSVRGIIAALEGMKVRKNRTFILNNSDYKIMMMVGKKDSVLPYSKIIEETENTPVKLVEFPDGHMSFIENESLFLHKIVHFIENI